MKGNKQRMPIIQKHLQTMGLLTSVSSLISLSHVDDPWRSSFPRAPSCAVNPWYVDSIGLCCHPYRRLTMCVLLQSDIICSKRLPAVHAKSMRPHCPACRDAINSSDKCQATNIYGLIKRVDQYMLSLGRVLVWCSKWYCPTCIRQGIGMV